MTIENSEEEWKATWSRDWLKTISAFYNTSGGRLVIGRADDGSYVGVDNPKDTLKVVSDTVSNLLHIPIDVLAEEFDGKTCIVVLVPEGNRAVSYDGGYYKRIGNTTRRLDGDALQDFLLSKLNRF
ncbi:MAG: ATP-binding protein [Thermoplasmata archaeon]|nr:ATP-binding protein [Thermoplasmata archaeon]